MIQKKFKAKYEFKIKRLNTRKHDLSFDGQKPRRLNSNGNMNNYYTHSQNSSMDATCQSSNAMSIKFKEYSNKVSKTLKFSPHKSSINVPPLITGDEYLIEYIGRLVNAIK